MGSFPLFLSVCWASSFFAAGKEISRHVLPGTSDPSQLIQTTAASKDQKVESTCSQNICLTKTCVKSASDALAKMNETADPCEDFYEFSCGNFVKETIIPDEKTGVNAFSGVYDQLSEKLKLIVEDEIKPSDSNATRKLKNFYASCMNETNLDKLGTKPLTDILSKMGGWPVIEGDSWNETNFDWIESVYNNRRIGYSIDLYFDFSVVTDIKNSSYRKIWFDQATLALSRKYLLEGLNNTYVKEYLKYYTDIAVYLGAERKRAEAENMDALLFQMALANISQPVEKRRNATKLYNLYSLKNLTEIMPSIPWVDYVNAILPSTVNVTENEMVVVSDINYFKNFTDLIAKTPKRTLANYLLGRVASGTLFYLDEDSRHLQFQYVKALTGKSKKTPRWKECLGLTSVRLPFAMSHLYVKNNFDDSGKSHVETLVRYVREEFWKVVNRTEWMDEKTKKEAIRKAESLKEYIGYPMELKNATKINEIYSNITISQDSFLNNVLSFTVLGNNYILGRLRKKANKADWKRHASVAVVNAYYFFTENAIALPAGILQGIFFDPNRPNYMNFGAIGFIIGHEITHGVDDRGRQYNSEGDLHNWWEAETQKRFTEKAKCIIYQYGNYTAVGINKTLNGINTQGENIADNGGVTQAYLAYRKWVDDHHEEKRLPGMHSYSTYQAFWISAAQIWCSKSRPKSLALSLTTGVHSPGRFRVIGSFSNSEEFSKDWNCPIGSKMNPKNKCSVW